MLAFPCCPDGAIQNESRALGGWQTGLLSVIALAGLVAPASAAVTPVSQLRTLDFSWEMDSGLYSCFPVGCIPIDVNHFEGEGSDQAPDFAAFSANLEDRVEMNSSMLGPDGFSISMSNAGAAGGSISGTSNPFEYQISIGAASTSAVLMYVFSVDEATAYHLTGEITTGFSGGPGGGGGGGIRLEGPLGEEIAILLIEVPQDCENVGCDSFGPFFLDSSGILQPGSYTVHVEVGGAASGAISFAGGSPFGLGTSYEASALATLSFPAAAGVLNPTTPILLIAAIVGLGLVMLGESQRRRIPADRSMAPLDSAFVKPSFKDRFE